MGGDGKFETLWNSKLIANFLWDFLALEKEIETVRPLKGH